MDLENLVNSLDDCKDGEVSHEILRQIYQHFDNLADYTKIDQHLAFAFPEDGGILGYVRSQITIKSSDKAREQAFRLLILLTQNTLIPKHILQSYCLKFKDVADLARKNPKERAKIQNVALECLQAILERFGTSLKASDIDASTLYWSLLRDSEKSSFQPTVRGKMFQILGILARNFSSDFMDKEQTYNQLFNHLVTCMKAQVDSSNHHMEGTILLGTVKGLNQFLFAFQIKMDTQNPKMTELYEKLEQIIDPKCSIEHDKATLKLKRREFQRAGLDLIANHGNIFEKHMYDHYEQWFNDLMAWARSNNMDDLRAGMKAIFKFLDVICTFIHSSSPTEEVDASFRDKLLTFFTSTFRFILDNKDCHKSELTVAIKGIGLLVDVCTDSELKDELFSKILKHVESIITEFNMPNHEKYSRSASLISTYLESLGNMLISMKISDELSLLTFQSRLSVIEQLSGLLASQYPDLGDKYKISAPYSFLKVIRNLYTAHFKWSQAFLENIVSEALRQIISCPTQVEVDILIESYQRENNIQTNSGNLEKEKKAAANKLRLKTLHAYSPFWIDLINISVRQNQLEVSGFIYNSIIQWALITIARLDLSIEFLDDEDQDNFTTRTQANANEDNTIYPMYTTRASLARDFHLFVNLVEFLQEFIIHTPLSHFEESWVEVYLSEMLNYIDDHPYVSGFYKIVGIVFEIMRKTQYFKKRMKDPDVQVVFQKASSFLKSLASKIQEYRDDLLLSVLNVWLSAPDEVVIENLHGLSVTLRIIFQTGRNCFPLAARGIEAVERWFEMIEFPFDIMGNLFNDLFPVWRSYFTCGGIEDPTVNKSVVLTKSTENSKSKLAKRKLDRMRAVELGDTTLNALQLSILKLIGSYGHFLNVDGEENALVRMSMEEKFLKYAVPFQDIKPDLYMDSILPRVLDICQHGASERQVRSSACECFHTLVLYFLGHSVNSSNRENHPELFQRMFIVMIKLGSDADVLVKQMFNPLTIQIIHWYTREGGSYGDIILHCITDCLAQSEDSPLRDFATVCISEYFSWSLKHKNEKRVRMITKTLSAMSTHAAPKYRQGSVLAFNSIYREYREDESLVNKYTFLFMHAYLVSLGLPSDFGEESILIRSTKQALRHLERIILKKKSHFNNTIGARKLPFEFAGPLLMNLVDWILSHSVNAEIIGRDECLRLVSILAPNIKNVGTLEAYLYKFEEGMTKRNCDLISMIEKYPTQDEIEDAHDFFLETLMCLTTSADLYEFFLSADFLIEKLLQSPKSKFSTKCCQLLECDPSYFEQHPSLSLRFFCKVGSIMSKSSWKLFDSKNRENFLLTSLIFSKQVCTSRGKVETMRLKLVTLWQDLLHVFDDDTKLKEKLKILITLDFEEEMSVKQINEMCKALEWLQILASHQFIDKVLTPEEILLMNEKIWNFINSKLFQVLGRGNTWSTKEISIRMEELLQNLLILAFDLGIEGTRIVDAVFDPTVVTSKGRNNTQRLNKGEVFRRVLLPALCHCKELLNFKWLTEKVSIEQAGILIQSLLNIAKTKRPLRRRFGTKLVEMTLAIWRPLHLNCDAQIIGKVIAGLASLNMELCRSSTELSEWWAGPRMMTSPHLSLKEKTEFIHFFALFALSRQASIVDTVINGMDGLVKQNFELSPSLKWSQEENIFAQVFLKLISVYEEIPNNLKLLRVIVNYATKACILSDLETTRDSTDEKPNETAKENICALEIRKMLRKVVERNNDLANEDLIISMANTILDMILDEKLFNCRTNRASSKFCLLPVLASMTEKAARTFYKGNVRRIIQLAERPAATIPEFNCKTAAFALLEMLSLKTGSDFIKGTELNSCYLEQLEKEQQGSALNIQIASKDRVLFKTILSTCQKVRASPIPTQRDKKLREANFSCNGSAFNAIAAILKGTKSEEKFYTGFIFYEKPGNVTGGIWSNLVDSSFTFTFPVVLDPALAKRITIEKAKPLINENKTTNEVQIPQDKT